MLIKLFRYEIKSLYKEYFFCLFSFFSCFFLLNFINSIGDELIIFLILKFFFLCLLFVSIFYPFILLFKKYKEKISSNEAYINLTLPVKTWQQIFVSMFTCFCLVIIHSVIVFSVLLLQIANSNEKSYMVTCGDLYGDFLIIGFSDLASLFIIILIILSLYALFISIIYSSITIGQLLKSKNIMITLVYFFAQFSFTILLWYLVTPVEIVLTFIYAFIAINFIITFLLFLLSSIIMTKFLNLE